MILCADAPNGRPRGRGPCAARERNRHVKDGRNCPGCLRDIGIWPVVRAPLPSRIRCPHCKARLRYRNAVPVMVVEFVLAVAVFAGSARIDDTLESVVVLVGLIVILELAAAGHLRRHHRLEVVRG